MTSPADSSGCTTAPPTAGSGWPLLITTRCWTTSGSTADGFLLRSLCSGTLGFEVGAVRPHSAHDSRTRRSLWRVPGAEPERPVTPVDHRHHLTTGRPPAL